MGHIDGIEGEGVGRRVVPGTKSYEMMVTLDNVPCPRLYEVLPYFPDIIQTPAVLPMWSLHVRFSRRNEYTPCLSGEIASIVVNVELVAILR